MAKKILIAEDEPHMVRLITYNLKKLGHELMVANDGLEAKEILEKDVPDIIISDVMMPRMDGFALLEWVKSQPRLAKVPFLILSSKGQMTDREKGDKLGADYYVTKPFDVNELVAKVKEILGET